MKKLLISAFAAMTLSAAAQASDLSYSYIEGGLIGTSNESIDTSGFVIGAGYAFTDNLFAKGSYSEREANEATPTVDGDKKSHYENTVIGFGANLPISRVADFILTAAHSKLTVDLGSDSSSYSANMLGAGVRTELPMGSQTELEVGVIQHYSQGESASGLEASLRTYVAKDYSLSLSYSSIDEMDAAKLTLRKDL